MDIPNWTNLKISEDHNALYANYVSGVYFFRIFFLALCLLCCASLYFVKYKEIIPSDLKGSAETILTLMLIIFCILTLFFSIKKFPDKKCLLNTGLTQGVINVHAKLSLPLRGAVITVYRSNIKGDEFGNIHVVISSALSEEVTIFEVSDLSYNITKLQDFCEYHKLEMNEKGVRHSFVSFKVITGLFPPTSV